MSRHRYLMEHSGEARRLDLKTDRESVRKQALWAGIRPGMRVADVGCGSGITTHFLHQLIQPGGEATGIDASESRIRHAAERYVEHGMSFVCRDFSGSLADLGSFDFVWARFVLEYHREKSREIVKNLSQILAPGGILCLIDLDHNCLNYYGLSEKLQRAIRGVMTSLEQHHDFDPYTGRKLYSYIYDMGFLDISVAAGFHHLIYGPPTAVDAYNWEMKVEIAAKKSGYSFDEYSNGYEGFLEECRSFIADPRRFIYTPLFSCRGRKPDA